MFGRVKRLFLAKNAGRSLLEGLAVLVIAVGGVSLSADTMGKSLYSQSLIFVGTLGAIWVAARLRLCTDHFWTIVGRELILAAGVSILVTLGIVVSGLVSHVSGPDHNTLFNSFLGIALSTGLYCGLRFVFYGRATIVHLVQSRLLWTMVSVQLELVLLVAGALVIIMLVGVTFLSGRDVLDAWLYTALPSAGVIVVLTGVVLVVLLPFAALVSSINVRRITHRVEAAAKAAEKMSAGDLSVRLQVSGDDEIARMQVSFNEMAERVERAVAELAAEKDRVEALLDDRRELFASVSHELRTPVAVIRSQLETLPGLGASKADYERATGQILKETLGLQCLIDDVFDLSRMMADGLTLQMQVVDVGTVLEERCRSLTPMAWDRYRVQVSCAHSEGIKACLDKQRLAQVLSNLIMNALRHTEPGGIVALTAKRVDDQVVLCVADTGAGIKSEDLDRIWEPFYQSDPATSDGSGAGLGLAIVREMTEAMQGSVSVHSEPGVGSEFYLRFPQT